MSRPGYSTSAVVQVQMGAPAKLLIGTDLLSQLGYLFIQTSIEGDDHDMLTATSGADDNHHTAIRDNSTTRQLLVITQPPVQLLVITLPPVWLVRIT